MRRQFLRLTLLLTLLCSALVPGFASASTRGPLVLAAASLQESMNAAADAWARAGHPRPVISFAGSSALARQIEAGAPADLFVSANERWMDVLQRDGRLMPGTRATFLGNHLVLITPVSSHVRVTLKPGVNLAEIIGNGRLAMANPGVPAGMYGQQALERLGLWASVVPKVVRADNVRSTLALVERGAAPFGIVYATDAKASKTVRVAGIFPDASHKPIRYPVAQLKTSTNPEAAAFRNFLLSPKGKEIFRRYGFMTS